MQRCIPYGMHMSMSERTYWIIWATDYKGVRKPIRGQWGEAQFSTREGADEEAAYLESWKEPEVVQMWEYR